MSLISGGFPFLWDASPRLIVELVALLPLMIDEPLVPARSSFVAGNEMRPPFPPITSGSSGLSYGTPAFDVQLVEEISDGPNAPASFLTPQISPMEEILFL